jgi:hypothetical protein
MRKPISTLEAADLLRLDPHTVRNYGEAGILTCRRRGKSKLEWDDHEVRDLLNLFDNEDSEYVKELLSNRERLKQYYREREEGRKERAAKKLG